MALFRPATLLPTESRRYDGPSRNSLRQEHDDATDPDQDPPKTATNIRPQEHAAAQPLHAVRPTAALLTPARPHNPTDTRP